MVAVIASIGTELGKRQDVISGELASFRAKYGDLAAKMNLCKRSTSLPHISEMSHVAGCLRVRRDEMCAANGWSGFVDLA
jgi:hypothetical protein